MAKTIGQLAAINKEGKWREVRPMTPIIWLYENGYLDGKVLYKNCGYFSDLDYLREKGVDITPYDVIYHRDAPEIRYTTVVGVGTKHADYNIIHTPWGWKILTDKGAIVKESRASFTFIIFSFVAIVLALGALYTVVIYNNMPKLGNVEFCNSLFVRQVDKLICIESLTKKGE